MVKCNNCGVQLSGNYDLCPNCGSNLSAQEENVVDVSSNVTCTKCGSFVPEGVNFCQECGTKVERIQQQSNVCKECGTQLPDNVLFCPTCGQKAEQPPKRTCSKCGAKLDLDAMFCEECGASINSDNPVNDSPLNSSTNSNNSDNSGIDNRSFSEKINLGGIIVPTILSVVVALILSFIGLLLGFSWLSFIFAVIISVGFFAGTIDNDANAIIFGIIVGIILGIFEFPVVAFTFGYFVAGVYEGIFGSSLIILIILGPITGYISNTFFKKSIRSIVDNWGLSWL